MKKAQKMDEKEMQENEETQAEETKSSENQEEQNQLISAEKERDEWKANPTEKIKLTGQR